MSTASAPIFIAKCGMMCLLYSNTKVLIASNSDKNVNFYLVVILNNNNDLLFLFLVTKYLQKIFLTSTLN